MDFGEALRFLREGGRKLQRSGWNGNKLPPTVPPMPEHIPKERLEIVGEHGFLLGSKGSVAVFDADKLDRLRGKKEFTESHDGYFVVSFYGDGNQDNIKLHNLLFDVPKGYTVDHINRNIHDNRACNIRFVTSKENNANREGAGRTSKYKGVSFDSSRSKWIVSICIDGKTTHLGRFDDEISAGMAYDDEAYARYGQYAYLNFPERKLRPRMWIHLQVPDEHSKMTLPYIYMKTADDNLIPWVASQTDIFAEDWQLFEE